MCGDSFYFVLHPGHIHQFPRIYYNAEHIIDDTVLALVFRLNRSTSAEQTTKQFTKHGQPVTFVITKRSQCTEWWVLLTIRKNVTCHHCGIRTGLSLMVDEQAFFKDFTFVKSDACFSKCNTAGRHVKQYRRLFLRSGHG